jgi:zinc metalloprotease ZmpB
LRIHCGIVYEIRRKAMPFTITPNVHVERDAQGVIRHLRHLQEPYTAAGLTAPTPQAIAAEYVRDAASIYGLDTGLLTDLTRPAGQELTDEGTLLRFAEEKSFMGTTVVSYVQTHYGLPIWEAGVSATLQEQPLRVTSSQSSIHFDVQVQKPGPRAKFMAARIRPALLAQAPGLVAAEKRPKITSTRLLIYRYDPALRYDPESTGSGGDEIGLQGGMPTLPLPTVPKTIQTGTHYVVTEVLFTLALTGTRDLNWRAFVEVQTGAVLYLRAFVSAAFGNVFQRDPLTLTGDATITPCSPGTTLDPLTSVVTLPGLTAPANPGDPQSLTGEFAQLMELASPNVPAPVAALPTGNFSSTAVSDNFSAVNAYFHVDAMFRMLQGMGIPVATYFDETTFPVPVDHRDGSFGTVNALAYGNATSTGSGGFGFNLCQAGCPVGIAADLRVVLHEFGHALLWDSVHSPNFGFAHSPGDSLAAILCDPGSRAPDRFLTFPWNTTVVRRHDRAIAGGWAWGGTNDFGGYSSEQILSTTLFRAYRSMGGDAVHSDTGLQLARRQLAARYMAYLIIRGVGSLATSPITPTPTPDVFATALMNADTGTMNFEGHPGGAFHKVIRWSFEKQGLYQPPGAPTPVTTEGAPPDVDVYIDDGRNGEYQYQHNFWNNTDIWNRLSADGGLTHETPVVGQTNYLYVRVKNRGTQAANGVVVRGFHCRPATGLVWPDDWQPTATAQLSPSGPIPAGGQTIVGPFEWMPEVIGHECLLMYVSATGDISNADPASTLPCAMGPIPHWRLVPFDNNIGQRNVAPVPGGGGPLNLALAFAKRRFWVNNPYDRPIRILLEAVLPDFLRQRGWEMKFSNPGGRSFTLGPRASREVFIDLQPGQDFSPEDVPAGTQAMIEIHTLMDGQLIGGMSYAIDPKMKTPAVELPAKADKAECKDAAKELLDCLNLPSDEVKAVRVKRITVEIDLKDDC